MSMNLSQNLMVGLLLCALGGCTGTSTYGTGKSQESQLVEDLAGMLMIGGGKKKKRIDYSARPNLVKPPADATALASPEEEKVAEDANFPVDPEEKLARLLDAAENADEREKEAYLAERRRQVREGISDDDVQRSRPNEFNTSLDHQTSAAEMARRAKEGKEDRLAKLKESRGILGTQPRRYLTQPPAEYRTPAETAEIGNVGEKEVDPTKKRRKSILGLLDRNVKDGENR